MRWGLRASPLGGFPLLNLFLAILPVSLKLFQRPCVVAGGVAYEEGTEAGIAGPAEVFGFEEFFVGVTFNQLHDVGVAFFEQGFC